MTTDFRALCAELLEQLDDITSFYDVPRSDHLINRALDALDEPIPEPRSKERAMQELDLLQEACIIDVDVLNTIRAALEALTNDN